MPPPILDSPLFNLVTINSLLSSPAPQTTELRIQLLSAKIHLLTRQLPLALSPSGRSRPVPSTSKCPAELPTTLTSVPDSTSTQIPTSPVERKDNSPGSERDPRPEVEVMQVRLELAKTYMGCNIPDYTNAESELSVVEKGTKGMIKRLSKGSGRPRPQDGVKGGDVGVGGGQQDEQGGRDGDGVLKQIKELRRESLKGLIEVEEGLGKGNRAVRWREALEEMDA
ncbi:hypothetical protein CI109_103065 [Kwoniella shandongensis]|uniref:Uncharacterized protein n=1 Tax=Kwoniella shandongensis TaxID=1734106 RepID=A0A5M6CD89_9TREE|nr:uncharacterized protein CI109_000256 [Kwoniella shandongensis]KAA5531415.1 hypothetical protein CI109_000256 [Kwoniella shandongensis]